MSSWRDVCGASVAARVQLAGCLALYEVSGFPQVSGVQMLFKTCGTGSAGGGDFEVRRDTAFAALEGGVATSSGGFVATSYQAVYAMAQCEGDLSTGTMASASPRLCSTSRSSAAAPPPRRRRRSRNAFEERGYIFTPPLSSEANCLGLLPLLLETNLVMHSANLTCKNSNASAVEVSLM